MDNFVGLPNVQSSFANLPESIDVPKRVLLSIFGFLAVINASSLRLCLDAALKQIPRSSTNCALCHKQRPLSARWTEIQRKYGHKFNATTSTSLPFFPKFEERARTRQTEAFSQLLKKRNCCRSQRSTLIDDINWPASLQTSLTVAFYVGYILSQVPGGLLAQKYGGKFVLAISLMMAAILTLLTPLAIRHGGPFALIFLRFFIGICEGPAFPALSALLARWIPPNERGKLGALALSGSQIGIVFVNIGSTVVLHLSHWPGIFYFFGGCALVWSFCFILYCSDEPRCDPFIKRNEYLYLQESISHIEPISSDITPIPWKKIFVNAPVWAMISSAIEYNWAEARTIANVPMAIQIIEDQSLAADLRANLKASTPHLFNWLMSIVAGTVCDILVERDIVTTTDVRRIIASISAFGSRLYIDLNSCFTCDRNNGLIERMNCIIGAMGSFYAGAKITPLDLSPNFAGILMAISNSVGSIAAVVLPQLEKHFPNSSLHRNLRSILCLITAMLASGDVQTFDGDASVVAERDEETLTNIQNF